MFIVRTLLFYITSMSKNITRIALTKIRRKKKGYSVFIKSMSYS